MKSSNVRVQLPIGGILAIIFTIAKLTGHLDWSWLWVLSPLWIPFVLFICLVGILFTVAAFFTIVGAIIK